LCIVVFAIVAIAAARALMDRHRTITIGATAIRAANAFHITAYFDARCDCRISFEFCDFGAGKFKTLL
jgi:hypothetical protein